MQQSEICCVCIRTSLELISITETDPNTIKYSFKLHQCVPEVVWNDDNRICEQCIEQLEAACAFRDLCLQSHAIRQQLLQRSVQEDVKTEEEITIEHELIIKVETDSEKSPPHLLCNEPEFASVKSLPPDEEENEDKLLEKEIPNKSYLRDLLETPQELLKVKNYTGDKNYVQYMKEKKITNLGVLEYESDDNDKILFVDAKENCLNTSELQEFLPPSVVVQEEKTNEQKETNEKEKTNENEPKACCYNLQEDGIEVVEENIKNFSKSLLRDLLLKPQQIRNEYVVESYFENRIKRRPDPPRTEHYYQCKNCAVRFKDRRNLTKHNKDMHRFARPWDCIYCNKSFKTQPELKQHEKSHLNQRKYECSICCRSYNTTSVLAKHKIIKHKSPNDWRYLCPHCNQKYPFKAYRDQHIRRNHTNAGNEYICYHCNTGFSSKLLLIAHIRYKHNSDNLMKQCHICKNTYINQAELEGHMLQRHNLETIKFPKKIKKYKCDKCSKLYTTLKAKNSHRDKCDGIRRHTSSK